MAGFRKPEGLIDYKKIANRWFYNGIDRSGHKVDLQARNSSVTMDHSVFVFSGYSRSLTISPFLPKFRQMPTFSPIS
jgi:hypothetical protein